MTSNFRVGKGALVQNPLTLGNKVNNGGLPKAEVFGRSQSFSLFGIRLRLPKFRSKYLAFGFILNLYCFKLKVGTSKKFNPPSN